MVASSPVSPDPFLPPLPSHPPSPNALNQLLFPTNRRLRSQLFHLLHEPIFRPRTHLTVRQHRDITLARINRLQQAGFFRNTVSAATSEGSRRYDTVTNTIALLDHSIEVKIGVSFGLFGATVRKLGSHAQSRYWLPRIESLQTWGCFALTELGHGSNVRGIETTAEYLPETQQFEIHTPSESAQKYWIGAAAESASHAVVFAKLSIAQVDHGINVFVVRLRDSAGNVCPGIRIADCGAKAGLNGVDNGRIWFTHVRIPREDMLSGLSQVAPDGTYTSSVPSPDARFGVILAALTGGRVGIAYNAISAALFGLTVAIRYSLARRAFAPGEGQPEVPLLYYKSQQRQLMIPLATAFVYAFCARDLVEEWYHAIDTNLVTKSIHSVSAGYKALFTWFMQDTLQASREACGGQGYKSDNIIAPLKADRDVMLTFEGANTVMLQQVGKVLMAELATYKKNGGRFAKDSVLAVLDTTPNSSGSSNTLDRQFFEFAFQKREKQLVFALGKEYKRAYKERNGSAFHAWNDCWGTAERAATAHMHRRIYEAHLQHVKRAFAKDVGCGEALTLCGQLWAVDVIRKDPDFLRLGCVSASQLTDLIGQTDGLCLRMAAIAEPLLEGVGIPDHLLPPIALDYVRHNSRAML